MTVLARSGRQLGERGATLKVPEHLIAGLAGPAAYPAVLVAMLGDQPRQLAAQLARSELEAVRVAPVRPARDAGHRSILAVS